ncbi:hypothetical protein GCK32_011054 [Trichostrongylus colubriformis]|uniref:Uncharacterized protein n=1 Tax=Trichostrongylus colubriformis TaxID=6319 RepID=A0AAN8IFB7_TRICO
MGDKSCYMGAGGYSGYMGSGTGGGQYAREEYAGNVSSGAKQTGNQPYQPYSSGGGGGGGTSGYAGNVGGSDAQASCYFGPK